MSKYAGFSDRFNGPILFLGEDLAVNRYFTIPEGRTAYYEHGKLFYEDSRTPVKAYRVWIGKWPKEGCTVEEAITLISRRRAEFEQSERNAPRKNGHSHSRPRAGQHKTTAKGVGGSGGRGTGAPKTYRH